MKMSYEAGAVSRRRICRLNPEDAAAAGLRQTTWSRSMPGARPRCGPGCVSTPVSTAPGTLPIDQAGLTILRISAGQRLEVRRIATVVLPQERLAEAAE